ncbi:MFS transporter [Streptomyces chromofuscus]|uniref:MFS transporter n=1 Tax=Streptomyces chromofuscus TaxID=42881 RepID=A0A7M2T9I8_STRCW|nr:MFS transporter [Streptomyces chromofuscus]QOV44061.1 MFS transporter [Streptomyces chromofuscus]GGT05923.1 MFS transporter [Streptomyces chromofuscus]
MSAKARAEGNGGPSGRRAAGADPRRWRALWVTLVAGFMSLLDVTIVAVALPSMQRDLHASAPAIQWVVSGYALAFALVLVTAGRIGDAIGRRRIFLVALGGFVACSACAGAAPSIVLLVVARVAQGLCAGCLAPQNSALIQQLFRGAERGRAFGLFGATVGLSSAVGPVVGGLILTLADGPGGWRWIFYVNVPVGAVALVLGLRLLPRTAPSGGQRLDLPGVALLGAGVLTLMLPLVLAESGGVRALWWLFPVGAALLVLFVRWERRVVARHGQPLLDPRLATSTRGYVTGAVIATLYFVGFSGVWLVFALFFQNGLAYSPLASGLAVTPFAVGSAVAAAVAGRLVERLGRLLTVCGLAAVILGLGGAAAVLRWAPADTAAWLQAPALLLGGLGSGCVISPNVTMTLRDVPVRMAGAAGGALQTGQRLGGAVGTAALPGLFYLALGDGGEAHYRSAVALAVACGVLPMLGAFALAVRDWRCDRGGGGRGCPDEISHSHTHAGQP